MQRSIPHRVLVTGANGFIGRVVCRRLLEAGYSVRACLRKESESGHFDLARGPLEFYNLGDFAARPNWEEPLHEVDAVIHLAARVHVTHDTVRDPLAEYMRNNVSATQQLADAAFRKVRRFVFVSTITVNGRRTVGKPFDEEDAPAPEDPYAVSKWEAEKMLQRLAANSDIELVTIRPPLVYGPGVRANFLRLMDFIHGGMPLPLANVRNRRSLIGVENLADVLVRCVDHPAAAGQTFVVSDGEDVSTRELATYIAEALGRRCRFLPLPESWLRLAAVIANKKAEADRLLGSLVVNCAKARERLCWNPPICLKDGLIETAQWYSDARARRTLR